MLEKVDCLCVNGLYTGWQVKFMLLFNVCQASYMLHFVNKHLQLSA